MTEAGLLHAERVRQGASPHRAIGPITRAVRRDTPHPRDGRGLIRGIDDQSRIAGPFDSFALRNPDLYAAGTRVNMVSSAADSGRAGPGHDGGPGRGQRVVERLLQRS